MSFKKEMLEKFFASRQRKCTVENQANWIKKKKNCFAHLIHHLIGFSDL